MIAIENLMNNKSDLLDEPENFSLALGGPLFQFFLRTRLSGPALELLVRRIIVITAIAWLPLLLLAALQGHIFGGVDIPFLFAFDTHARLLPLLIAAEMYVHDWSRGLIRQFLDREIIAAEDHARFDGIVASALRLRNSIMLELMLIVFAFAGHWAAVSLTLTGSAWYGAWVDGRLLYTAAGYWGVWISLPILRFIILRWYFRIFIWYRFLWQVARLPLRLNTLHPDRAGGLGFLNRSVLAFAPVLLAHTIFLAGAIANRICMTARNYRHSNWRLRVSCSIFCCLCWFRLLSSAAICYMRSEGRCGSTAMWPAFMSVTFAKNGSRAKIPTASGCSAPAISNRWRIWATASPS